MVFFSISIFTYYAINSASYKSFIINTGILFVCALYFNYYVGFSRKRLVFSVMIFYLLLSLSTIIMLLDHVYPARFDRVRELMLGSPLLQGPTGVSVTIFNFGYQVAALVSFLVIFPLVYKKPFWMTVGLLFFSLLGIFFGMQRSVFVTFVFSAFAFSLFYYRFKSVFIMGLGLLLGFLIYSFVLKKESAQYDNILVKEQNSEENRSGLMTENLKIYMDYPYGLVFYGKNWYDVSKNNPVFSGGLTSHNAYFMFITYLGPFLGFGLLFLIYRPIVEIFKRSLRNIREEKYALMVCLCFSFLGVSLNALFHNAWLLNGNGAAVFLYFAILQLNYINFQSKQV
ncbi:MAG TPA: hypothetical protein VEV16_12750 [Daejeonella sp.]|nr:hypothetical protein [Daejeonella sp.]